MIYVAFRVLQKSSGNASNGNENVLSRNESTFHVLAGVNVPSRFFSSFPHCVITSIGFPFAPGQVRTLALTPSTPPWHSFCPLKGPECLLNPLHPFSSTQPHAQSLPGLPLIAPVCSISGRPAWFSCLFDLTLSPAPHPGAVLPCDSAGSHNILYFVFLTPNYATCYSLFVRKQFPIFLSFFILLLWVQNER